MFRIIVLVLSFLVPMVASALTIEEAVDLALKSNNNIKKQLSNVEARQFEKKSSILVYFPSVGLGYDYYLTETELSSGQKRVGAVNLYAQLNLFNGLGDFNTTRMATSNVDVANYQYQTTSFDVVLSARKAFIDVLKASHNVMLAKENLKLLQLQKRDAKLSADNGLIARNELLKVDVYLSNAELRLLTAESQLNLAKLNLENVTNIKITSGNNLIDPMVSYVHLPDENILKDEMFSSRSDLKSLEESYKISKYNQVVARKNLFPKVDLKVSYNGFGDTFNPFDNMDEGVTAIVSATWNILSAAVSVVQAKSQTRVTQGIAYGIADTKQSLSLQLRSGIESYSTSREQLRVAEVSEQQATENYRVTKNLYDQNAATMTDLLDASVLLNEAKLNKSTALYGIMISIYELERIVEKDLTIEYSGK